MKSFLFHQPHCRLFHGILSPRLLPYNLSIATGYVTNTSFAYREKQATNAQLYYSPKPSKRDCKCTNIFRIMTKKD